MNTNAAVNLNLSGATGQFTVRWFDPRAGGALQTGSVAQVTGGGTVSLGTAPLTSTNDWVVLVRLVDVTPPGVIINTPANGANVFANLPVQVSATVTDNVAVASVEFWVDGDFQPPVLTGEPYDFTMNGLSLGAHTVTVVGEDTSANRGTNTVEITIVAPAAPPLTLINTSGSSQLQWTAPGFLMQQAGIVTGPWTTLVPQPASPFVLTPTNPESYFRLYWRSP